MSQLVQAPPARVPTIKSRQSGTISATNGGAGAVTVSAVDPNNSMLLVSSAGGGILMPTGSAAGNIAGATLTNATTISWTGGYTAGAPSGSTNSTLYWQLLEFNP